MKRIIILAGATALVFAGPAFAKPGKGHGGHGNPHVTGHYAPGLGACPPGLAKKGCVPPGQAKKYGVGQRLPAGMFSSYAYNQIPYDLRSQYGLNPHGNYYYGGGHLYNVDPRTMIVQQAIAALLR